MGAYFQKYYLNYLKPPTNIVPEKMVTKPLKMTQLFSFNDKEMA